MKSERQQGTSLKLAFVTPHYPPSSGFGGVTETSYRLTGALAGLGVDVSVITSDATLNGRIPVEHLKTEEKPNLKIYPYHYFKGRKSAPSLSGHRIIYEVVKKCDLVYLNGIFAYPMTVAAWAAQRYKKPYIVALRNGLDPFMFQIRKSKKMLGFYAYVRPILKKADVIHATAEQEVRHARAFGIDGNFVIIPNGIDTVRSEHLTTAYDAEIWWPHLSGKRVVLFLSRISPQKGLDMLIPAWASLQQKYKDSILVIAGPDYQGHEAEIRNLVDFYKVRDSVLFTGEVRDERKWALYQRASLFVLPSYSENFGNVIAEALAFERPVLTTTATPWQAINEFSCGRVVEPNLAAVTNGLDILLSKTNAELDMMGKNAPPLLATMNTWQNSARQFVDLYLSMLKR